jgi:hypothetical protein
VSGSASHDAPGLAPATLAAGCLLVAAPLAAASGLASPSLAARLSDDSLSSLGVSATRLPDDKLPGEKLSLLGTKELLASPVCKTAGESPLFCKTALPAGVIRCSLARQCIKACRALPAASLALLSFRRAAFFSARLACCCCSSGVLEPAATAPARPRVAANGLARGGRDTQDIAEAKKALSFVCFLISFAENRANSASA